LDNWQEDRLTQMMISLQQELIEKEEELEKLQAVVEEKREAKPPSITTAKANTMTETTPVNSPFVDFFQ
jgi:hypothetical protein